MIYVDREDWEEAGYPIRGPLQKAATATTVIHYPGNPNQKAAPVNMVGYMRAMQRDYTDNRGYSLGYGWVVVSDALHPEDGWIYEARGHEFNNAANAGRKVPGNANDWTKSIQVTGRFRAQATPKAAASVRWLTTQIHDGWAEPWKPGATIDHRTVDYTPCCGDGLRLDIAQGRFDPAQITNPKEDDTMIALRHPTKNHVVHIGSGLKRRYMSDTQALDTLIACYRAAGNPIIDAQTKRPVLTAADIKPYTRGDIAALLGDDVADDT